KVLATLPDLEMKDRVRLITDTFHDTLPISYKKKIAIFNQTLALDNEIESVSTHEQGAKTGLNGFLIWPFLQYIETYGLDDFDTSFKGMYEMTKRFTAEFAIRPFLQCDDKYVFRVLEQWKKDPDKHVRRLCSEGIRPILPWGLKVKSLEQTLPRNIKMLEYLRDDSSQYVRTSVANHLKDISAIDTGLMLSTCKSWNQGNVSKERQWVIRRASQNLLKKGHPEALRLHGYHTSSKIELEKFTLSNNKVKEGGKLTLTCTIKNHGLKDQKVLIDYVIGYLKKDGSISPKPFRLRDTQLLAGNQLLIVKDIHFKRVTTRKHYKGEHTVAIQINGKKSQQLPFVLI
ncbi:MAG: hypothetical protein KDK51_11050, partial [Deltaproteobacteria bacterium]|nr:hypothetical protein [Deltaproteobacteria bacterium]